MSCLLIANQHIYRMFLFANCFLFNSYQITNSWVRYWLVLQGTQLFYFDPKYFKNYSRNNINIVSVNCQSILNKSIDNLLLTTVWLNSHKMSFTEGMVRSVGRRLTHCGHIHTERQFGQKRIQIPGADTGPGVRMV